MTVAETSTRTSIQPESQVQRTTEVHYRAALPDDVPEMTDLFLSAVGNLYTRNNVSASPPPRGAVLVGYEHLRSTGIFHVAEMEGEIIAIAGAIVRDHLWFLSAFWARPDLQRKGIGMPLLRRVWNAGQAAAATNFFTWSSVDPTAMAAYMKLGMLPGTQILHFEGIPRHFSEAPAGYVPADLERSVATAMDRELLGTGREVDHEFWTRAGAAGRQVLHKAKVAGYYYINKGVLGPLAWKEPQDGKAVLALALGEATESEQGTRLAVPGMNHTALRFVLDAGLRLTSFSHLLTTAPVGRLEQYLPSGPSLF